MTFRRYCEMRSLAGPGSIVGLAVSSSNFDARGQPSWIPRRRGRYSFVWNSIRRLSLPPAHSLSCCVLRHASQRLVATPSWRLLPGLWLQLFTLIISCLCQASNLAGVIAYFEFSRMELLSTSTALAISAVFATSPLEQATHTDDSSASFVNENPEFTL